MNHKRRKSTGGNGGGKNYKARNKLKQILKGIDINLGDLPKMNKIPNKIKRSEVFARRKRAKNLIKSQNREKRKREEKLLGDKAPPKKIPKTIDDMKIPNETLVEKDDVEVEEDEKNDEFGEYFDEGKSPKILMTSSRRPSCELEKNIMALKKVFPRSTYVRRRNYYIKEICEYASQRSFTDVMVWREDEKFQIWELILIHLPFGPTATFRITHFVHPDKIENKGKPTKHRPEIILNGFTSRLGHTIGRMFASLFPHNPQFHGREVVTLHNQRDYIFFRFHRYEFENVDECNLQELGPSFTLRLRSLQKGTFDTKFGEYEYFWKTEQTVNRKKFYL